MDTSFFIASAIIWVVVGGLYFFLSSRYRRANRVVLSRLFLAFGILLALPVVLVIAFSLTLAAGIKLWSGLGVLPALLSAPAVGVLFTGIQVWLSVLIADLARRKGRGWELFFFLSVFVSPPIMWIIALSISPTSGSQGHNAPTQEVSTPLAQDLVEQIKKLGELKEQGLISDEDFENKKNDLLKRI